MTGLQLYKFCQDKEMDWRGNQLIIWIRFNDIEDFAKFMGYGHFAEGGMEVNLQYESIAFDLVDICESYGIDPTNIVPFKKD